MKTAVRVKIERIEHRFGGERHYYWNVYLIGASGRKLHADTLIQSGAPYISRWYASETYTGVGFRLLYDAKLWYMKNMDAMHPEFVKDERCAACKLPGVCPEGCAIRLKGE